VLPWALSRGRPQNEMLRRTHQIYLEHRLELKTGVSLWSVKIHCVYSKHNWELLEL
jgi:hypothetical protein